MSDVLPPEDGPESAVTGIIEALDGEYIDRWPQLTGWRLVSSTDVVVTGVFTGVHTGCRVYWGSHGCRHPRGHSPHIPHECDCCECENHPDEDSGCVAAPPYYGKITLFYGEDAETLGLPLVGGGANRLPPE